MQNGHTYCAVCFRVLLQYCKEPSSRVCSWKKKSRPRHSTANNIGLCKNSTGPKPLSMEYHSAHRVNTSGCITWHNENVIWQLRSDKCFENITILLQKIEWRHGRRAGEAEPKESEGRRINVSFARYNKVFWLRFGKTSCTAFLSDARWKAKTGFTQMRTSRRRGRMSTWDYSLSASLSPNRSRLLFQQN